MLSALMTSDDDDARLQIKVLAAVGVALPLVQQVCKPGSHVVEISWTTIASCNTWAMQNCMQALYSLLHSYKDKHPRGC